MLLLLLLAILLPRDAPITTYLLVPLKNCFDSLDFGVRDLSLCVQSDF